MTIALVPFTFNSIKLFTVTINGKHWTRAKEICQSLKYHRETGHVIRDHCSCENIRHKYELVGLTDVANPVQWPSDSQKYDLYINEEAMYELGFTSQQDKAKHFRKYCFNTLFPQLFQRVWMPLTMRQITTDKCMNGCMSMDIPKSLKRLL